MYDERKNQDAGDENFSTLGNSPNYSVVKRYIYQKRSISQYGVLAAFTDGLERRLLKYYFAS